MGQKQAAENNISVSTLTSCFIVIFSFIAIGIHLILKYAPQCTWIQILFPVVQTKFVGLSGIAYAGISRVMELDTKLAVLFVLGCIAYLAYISYSAFQDRKHMYSATVSFNYFAGDDGSDFTFKAWKEIPLQDIRISNGQAHSFRWQTSIDQPFLRLQGAIPAHMKIIKALGLQISDLFSYQWTEHICGGVKYHFTDLVIGLIYEEDPKACGPNGSHILQWRIFVISKDDLLACDKDVKEVICIDEAHPTPPQKTDRYMKIKKMRDVYLESKFNFVSIKVPTTRDRKTDKLRSRVNSDESLKD